MTVRILLADDHQIMRDGLRSLVQKEAEMEVVAEAERTELERLAAALREGPPAARVTNVQLSWAEPTGRFTGLSIQASG